MKHKKLPIGISTEESFEKNCMVSSPSVNIQNM